jgi:hypothetical protein
LSPTNKEVAKHEKVIQIYEAMEKKMASIEREYLTIMGTKIRGTFTAAEINRAFEPLLKKRFKKLSSSIMA